MQGVPHVPLHASTLGQAQAASQDAGMASLSMHVTLLELGFGLVRTMCTACTSPHFSGDLIPCSVLLLAASVLLPAASVLLPSSFFEP